MDKFLFEKQIRYRPKLCEHVIFWIMIIFYSVGLLASLIFSWMYLPIIQNHAFNRTNGVMFSLYSNEIFAIAFLFFSIIILWIILTAIFSTFFGAKKIILWYDIASSKAYNYEAYKFKRKRNAILATVVVVISLFFSSVSFFVYARISNTGIYYNRIFEFTERHYNWNDLKSVSIIPRIRYGRNKTLSPELILEFGENRIDIWGGAGLGSPDSYALIKALRLIRENTDIVFAIENIFPDELISLLNNSTERKRNNILSVFNYLNNCQ